MRKINYTELPLSKADMQHILEYEVEMIENSVTDEENAAEIIKARSAGLCLYLELHDCEFDIVYKLNPMGCPNPECKGVHLFPTVFFIEKNSFDIIGLTPNFNVEEDSFPNTMDELIEYLMEDLEDYDEDDDILTHLTNNN